MKLDMKDLRILSLLDQDSRMPLSQIAKRSRLNKDVVRYRINNLETQGVIVEYYTLINTHRLGYLTFRIYFSFIDLSRELRDRLIAFLQGEFGAGQIFLIDGEYQLGILTWERSIYNLERKLRWLKQKFGMSIERLAISIFTKLNHYPRKTLPMVTARTICLKEEEVVRCDKTDIRLLQELSGNSRMTTVALGKILGVPQRTVVHRIRQLERRRLILGYRINLNIEKLHYENYFLEVFVNPAQDLKEIEAFAEVNRNCIYSDYVLSGADIELELELQGKRELLKFIAELQRRFPLIRKIKYWSTQEYLKISYIPEDVL